MFRVSAVLLSPSLGRVLGFRQIVELLAGCPCLPAESEKVCHCFAEAVRPSTENRVCTLSRQTRRRHCLFQAVAHRSRSAAKPGTRRSDAMNRSCSAHRREGSTVLLTLRREGPFITRSVMTTRRSVMSTVLPVFQVIDFQFVRNF